MWMISRSGFTSTVAYDPTKDREANSPFKAVVKEAGTHLLVRGRLQEDIDDLKRVDPDLVWDDQPHADYRFRAVITRENFKAYMSLLTDEIQYDSHFKEEFRDNAPQGSARYSALMTIWSLMANFQPTRPYSGSSWTSSSWSNTKKGKKNKGRKGLSSKELAAMSDAEYEDWWNNGTLFSGSTPPAIGSATAVKDDEQVTVRPVVDDALWKDDDAWLDALNAEALGLDLTEAEDNEPIEGEIILEEAGWGTLDLTDVAVLVSERGFVHFSDKEVTEMDDEGFELYNRMCEHAGRGVAISDSQVSILLNELKNDIKDGKF